MKLKSKGAVIVWNSIENIIDEISKCESIGAVTAAIAMSFVCIDTMVFLSLPSSKGSQTRADFIEWVDRYMKAHPDQSYDYAGKDVYGARCALLHAFGSESDYHRKNPDVKLFAWIDGGQHLYDPDIDPRLVIIGTASFLNDVKIAVGNFLLDCKNDPKLRARAEVRLPVVLNTLTFMNN
jgi:hypothetical protein